MSYIVDVLISNDTIIMIFHLYKNINNAERMTFCFGKFVSKKNISWLWSWTTFFS